MLLTDERGTVAIACVEIRPDNLRCAVSPLATRILRLLSAHPDGLHASQIARHLREPEQKVHYHTKRLRHAGILKVDRHEETSGATAKVLRISAPALAVRYTDLSPSTQHSALSLAQEEFLAPFIEAGKLQAKIIVGSPDPHGPESARGRDAAYAIDLGLFLGTRVRIAPGPAVALDTETRDLRQHLIIIGGPVVNRVAERMNAKAPVRYDTEKKAFRTPDGLISSETAGIIARFPNPFAPGRWILWIAGKRHGGTRAAILALLTRFGETCDKARHERTATWIVVEGIDADSDGIIDSVSIR